MANISPTKSKNPIVRFFNINTSGEVGGRDLPLFGKYPSDKKIGIGVISHCNTVVEPLDLPGDRRWSSSPLITDGTSAARVSDAS